MGRLGRRRTGERTAHGDESRKYGEQIIVFPEGGGWSKKEIKASVRASSLANKNDYYGMEWKTAGKSSYPEELGRKLL